MSLWATLRGDPVFMRSVSGWLTGKENQVTEQDEQARDPGVGVCHVCGQIFDTQLALSQHLMDVHEEDVLDSDPTD